MYLAPLNYDRFFKKVFSDLRIAKQFLEDFFGFTIEKIEPLPKAHKLTNESSLIEFDFRCKVDGEYIIIDMQQWYKHDIVKRFYMYHCSHTVLQLEELPIKKVGKEKKIKDYRGLLPVKTLIWLVDDALKFKTDYSGHIMLPEDVEDFLKDEKLWPKNNCLKNPEQFKKSYDKLLQKRESLLNILNNDSKNLMFLRQNRLIFAFQRNIVQNLEKAIEKKKEIKPYMRWFEFAQKTRDDNNIAKDFEKFENDEIFEEIMRKLNHSSLNTDEKKYIHYWQELEGIAETKWKDGRAEEREANIIALIEQNILTDAQIAQAFKVSVAKVQTLRKQIKF